MVPVLFRSFSKTHEAYIVETTQLSYEAKLKISDEELEVAQILSYHASTRICNKFGCLNT